MRRRFIGRRGGVSGMVLLGLFLGVASAQESPITISLVANKTSYLPTDPIQLQITVTNTSGHEVIARGGFLQQTFERLLLFMAPNGQPIRTKFAGSTDEPGPPLYLQGQEATLIETIPAGEQRILVISDARFYYSLNQSGQYTAQVVTSLETFSEFVEDPTTGGRFAFLDDPGRRGFDPLTSNRITFVLTGIRSGDVDGDGMVGCSDVAIVRGTIGTRAGQPGFNPAADVNHDGVINIRDLDVVLRIVLSTTGTPCP